MAFFHSLGMVVESFLLKLLGLLCLIIGVAGLFLPIIPGTVLIVMGLGLLGCKFVTRWAKNVLVWMKLYFKNKKRK